MENLIRVSTYATKVKQSTRNIYKLIESGKLDCIEIDGVKFIKMEDEK